MNNSELSGIIDAISIASPGDTIIIRTRISLSKEQEECVKNQIDAAQKKTGINFFIWDRGQLEIGIIRNSNSLDDRCNNDCNNRADN